MSAQVKRGLAALAIAILMLWAFWYAFGWRECSKASVPPGFDGAIYTSVFGPEVTFFITVPLLALAFALGYRLRWELRAPPVAIAGLVLIALAAGLGFAVGKPVAVCGPI
jgi:hypothetical protein